jgi:DNA-binding NarL/FixJ family response regulator
MNGQPEPYDLSGQASPSAPRGRVVLADDDVLVREGLASLLLRSGFDVVGLAADADQLIAKVHEFVPDLVIVDIRMPPSKTTEGLRAARIIRATFPQIAILVLSAHVEIEHTRELLSEGQRIGYLLKSRVTSLADFLEALDRICRDGTVVDPALVQELLAIRRRPDHPLEELSSPEREVLALMAEGRSNVGIARRLEVTEGAVEEHVQQVITKLRLPDIRGRDNQLVLHLLNLLDIHHKWHSG